MRPNASPPVRPPSAYATILRQPPSRAALGRFRLYEYAYFFMVFYALTGSALGISLGPLGIVMHMALAGLVVLRRRGRTLTADLALVVPLLCAASFMAIQKFVHQESIMDGAVRPFVSWVLALLIIKSLCSRPGFIRRFGAAAFLIGLTVLPFLRLSGEARAGLDAQSGLSNPNDLAEWFGFCALVFTIRGLEARRLIERWVSGAIALFSLSIVGLTVSRGTLVAFAVAIVVTFRTRLRRSFMPILFIIVAGGAAFAVGLFDSAIEGYGHRGLEDTGRMILWPQVVHRIEESPLAGVGVSQLTTAIVGHEKDIGTPHNGFLFLALGSGFLPFALFSGYWILGFYGARRASKRPGPDSAYLLPLYAYAFVAMQWSSQGFFAPWSVVTLGVCLYHFSTRRRRLGRRQRVQVRLGSPRNATVIGREF